MTIVIEEATFVLGELPQVHAELACVLDRGVEEGFVLHSRVERFELVLEIRADSFYCLVGGKTVWVDPAFEHGAGLCLYDIGRIDVEIEAEKQDAIDHLELVTETPRSELWETGRKRRRVSGCDMAFAEVEGLDRVHIWKRTKRRARVHVALGLEMGRAFLLK